MNIAVYTLSGAILLAVAVGAWLFRFEYVPMETRGVHVIVRVERLTRGTCYLAMNGSDAEPLADGSWMDSCD